MEFQKFPKIPRYKRTVIVTEKIDGTNAQIFIGEDGQILIGSRNRWISTEDDNYGFADWVRGHEYELLKLGPGRHFGEWWGSGIQRGYGLDHKRFSLFNVGRWKEPATLPERVHVVPILWQGQVEDLNVPHLMAKLKLGGSWAAPGFYNPEGIVVYHTAAKQCFKVTYDHDEKGKESL
ncbi:MAG TPA: hypothetical protein ENH62_15925 [Marinobacter sp.]|nr:hypothetical protein [Marinobacter sp.]